MNIKKILLFILCMIIVIGVQTLLTMYKPDGVAGFIVYIVVFAPLFWAFGHYYNKIK